MIRFDAPLSPSDHGRPVTAIAVAPDAVFRGGIRQTPAFTLAVKKRCACSGPLVKEPAAM